MDLLDYSDDDREKDQVDVNLIPTDSVHSAPAIEKHVVSSSGITSVDLSSATQGGKKVDNSNTNLPLDAMALVPSVVDASLVDKKKSLLAPNGSVSSFALDPTVFAQQYNNFANVGYAILPNGVVAHNMHNSNISSSTAASVYQNVPSSDITSKAAKRARSTNINVASSKYSGSWGEYEGESESRTSNLQRGTLTLQQKLIRLEQGLNPDAPGKLEKDELAAARAKIQNEINQLKQGKSVETASISQNAPSTIESGASEESTLPLPDAEAIALFESQTGSSVIETPVKSTFFGKEMVDYLGRSWTAPPKSLKVTDHECRVPRKAGKPWKGHKKAVQSVEFFPKTGHLLLSASMDNTVRVWDVVNSHSVLRSYEGHSSGVRGAKFSHDGVLIASNSFDRRVNIWDTETGEAIHRINVGSSPLDTAWHPQHNNTLLIAQYNKIISQLDTRTGKIELEYRDHLSAVNAVRFLDSDGHRFVSASDDKKMLVWDLNTPVPVKFLADSNMHVASNLCVHPTSKYFLAQCMDNSIPVFEFSDRVGRVNKKVFHGHVTAGFACGIAISPDGKYVVSGDGEGNSFIWNWSNTQIVHKFKSHHGGPTIGSAWHPIEPSWLVTCGWDGKINLWV